MKISARNLSKLEAVRAACHSHRIEGPRPTDPFVHSILFDACHENYHVCDGTLYVLYGDRGFVKLVRNFLSEIDASTVTEIVTMRKLFRRAMDWDPKRRRLAIYVPRSNPSELT